MNADNNDFSTIVDIGFYRSRGEHAIKLAYCFLVDGVGEELCITFGDLHERACSIAAFLTERNLKGERVLLLFSPGTDYICSFMGCLYAGAIAVPAFPPTGKRIIPRLTSIVRDCDAALALCDSGGKEQADRFFKDDDSLSRLDVVSVETLFSCEEASEFDLGNPPSADDIAFLQYTSGSTSEPKGVIVTHGNLIHNERMIAQAFEHDESTCVVGWLPPYHDMGLIGNILQPLYLGCPYYFMSPGKAMQDPYKWLLAISRYRGTTSGAPNFAYDLCVQKISDEQKRSLDLSSWTVAYNGSEPIRASSMERFTEAFSCCGFNSSAWLPCYGLAEATLLVSGDRDRDRSVVSRRCDASALEQGRIEEEIENARSTELVGSGHVSSFQDLRVVDADRKEVSGDRVIGELWIKGPNVSPSYWGNEPLSHCAFANWLGDEGPYCRTGDLGFLEAGQLFVTGRLKDLIIINGRNVYPQDIERLVQESHEKAARNCGAAFGFTDSNGDTAVALVQEVSFPFKSVDFSQMYTAARKALRAGLELHVASIVWVKPGNVPKTTSGKVQRARCRERFLSGDLSILAQEDLDCGPSSPGTSEASLDPLAHWVVATLLKQVDRRSLEVHLNTSLASFGLDSIQAIEFAHTAERTYGVPLPVESLFDLDTVSELVEHLRKQGVEIQTSEQVGEDPAHYSRLSIDQLKESDLDHLDESQIDALLKTLT